MEVIKQGVAGRRIGIIGGEAMGDVSTRITDSTLLHILFDGGRDIRGRR